LFSLLLSVFFAGCNEREPGNIHIVHFDEASFHKVLTLFFDGVPPLGDEMVETGAGNIDPNVPGVPKRPDVDWYIHEPLKDCARCHGSQRGRNFSREVQLTAKVPQLCYECHDAVVPAASEGWMHGPAAAGECLLCHDPHKTTNPHLLREQIPSLCYKCHQEMAGESTPDDVKEPHSQCIGCHAAHASPTEGSTGRVPELCYECHESLAPAALKGWVHGPVAVGQCQLCHEPHKTGNQHLLRERIPALCYGCHEEESVKSIGDHWRESYVDCSNCHEGHVSPEQHLLRRSRQRESVEVEAAESVSGPSGQ
jgi:predicted CXXCH cytochrome family protein